MAMKYDGAKNRDGARVRKLFVIEQDEAAWIMGLNLTR